MLVWREKANQLAGVKSALSSCQTNQTLTKEANDALQKERDTIAGRLARAKRVQQSRCVPVSNASNTQPTRAEHAGSNGISSDWLLDYAAQCETYRSERIILEKFVSH